MTPFRYTIDDALWLSFSREQVDKQIARLTATNRLIRPPTAYTVRVDLDTMLGTYKQTKLEPLDGEKFFVDADFNADSEPQKIITVGRYDFNTVRLSSRASFADEWLARMRETDRVADVPNPSWIEGNYQYVWLKMNWREDWQIPVAKDMAAVLAILLQDRGVNKLAIEPKPPKSDIAKKLAARRGGISVPEMVLYVPERSYQSAGGTHASPRMHYRAEHVRRQSIGPRGGGDHKEIVIEGTWINIESVEDRGTPLARNYRLKE